jgi:hypothetical protein
MDRMICDGIKAMRDNREEWASLIKEDLRRL